jgi:hypothetical protein
MTRPEKWWCHLEAEEEAATPLLDMRQGMGLWEDRAVNILARLHLLSSTSSPPIRVQYTFGVLPIRIVTVLYKRIIHIRNVNRSADG